MSIRELVILGSGSQVPTRHRNQSGYFVRWDAHGFLIDPGEGTQRQMVHHGVTATAITRILISHFHGDHCLGLAGIAQRISLDQVPHPITAFYPASGQVFFDRLCHASIYYEAVPLRGRPITEPGEIDRDDELTVECRLLDHGVDCLGYRVQEVDQWNLDPEKLAAVGLAGPLVGQLKREGVVEHDGRTIRLEDVGVLRRGQSVAFISDTRMCEAAVELARDVDLLICEATYLESEAVDAGQHGHLTARQAARIAARAGARRLVLTHFSQRYSETDDFIAEASAIHPDVVAAEDGMVIGIERDRTRPGNRGD